jgi:hypothetical protein
VLYADVGGIGRRLTVLAPLSAITALAVVGAGPAPAVPRCAATAPTRPGVARPILLALAALLGVHRIGERNSQPDEEVGASGRHERAGERSSRAGEPARDGLELPVLHQYPFGPTRSANRNDHARIGLGKDRGVA